MAPFALALALFLQAQPAPTEPATTDPATLLGAPKPEDKAEDKIGDKLAEAPPAADEAAAPEDRFPAGAPHDDYQFVAWCYGNLRAYLDLHDQVMPEVTRIESTFRPPNRKLSDDLKVYADMQKEGRAQLKQFQAALTAAEKASLKPINTVGAAAVSKGADVWRVTPDITPARLAQAWMSWDLPARCEVTAKTLQTKATLMGGAFKVNEEPDPPPAEAAAPAADAPPPAPPETPTPPSGR
ncbi:hypothetical protein [Phenylobacterium sp.]|uniref:hypothetical protein n=1 Tax=Phenylobacterium sp. TaxID=1871053 RepID=UPI002D0ACA54|nr:hypothetical protein [Phenylobacterium sp.]HLZ75722.1 hypothetical protein [Phenylobacterium sp.]